MDRRVIGATLIAVLGIIALSLAAATLTSTVQPGGNGGGGLGGTGDANDGVLPPANSTAEPSPLEIPFLREFLLLIAIGLLILGLAYMVINWRETAKMVLAVIIIVIILYLLFQFFAGSGSPLGFGTQDPVNDGGGATGSDPSPPTIVLPLVFAVIVVAALIALVWRRGILANQSEPIHETEDQMAAVGRAAGRAADRLEAYGDVDNEVYRAWLEMTALLDGNNSESTTPGEFEAAAIDAGMNPPDVTELTRLFEDVRYGGYQVEKTDEQRAITVFRRIEATYTTKDT